MSLEFTRHAAHLGDCLAKTTQHARQILPITRQALVLERGRVVHAGASDALLRDDAALDAWLGAGATSERKAEEVQ